MCGEHVGVSTLPLPCALPWPGTRLWRVDLDGSGSEAAHTWLSATEVERAKRFVFAHDARRYRVAHVALRQLLAEQAGLPARAEFSVGVHGKPSLGCPGGIGFNMSHSAGVALIGIGGADDLGVDIECVRVMDDVAALAERNFTAAENDELRGTPQGEAVHAFLRGWTRKEACLKALGTGLSIEPGCFDAGLVAQARSVTIPTPGGGVRVHVQSVDVGVGMLAAIARITPSSQH